MVKKAWLIFSLLLILAAAAGIVPAKGNASLNPPPPGLGPEFQISDTNLSGIGVEHYLPAAAYDTVYHAFLVVWRQTIASNPLISNIYAQRVSLSGGLIGQVIQVSFGDTDAQPAVAYNGFDRYLVVWQHEVPGSGGRNEIWGQLISWDGTYINGNFRIFTWPTQSLEGPKVAFGGNFPYRGFLVIWNSFNASTGQPTDISGVHVSEDGNPDELAHNFAYNGWTVPIGSYFMTLYFPQQANLVYNVMRNTYFIVYQGFENDSPDWEVLGQFAYDDGSLFNYWLYLGSLHYPGNGQTPAVASGGDNGYLAVWSQENSPGPAVTEVQMFNAQGQKVGPTLHKIEPLGDQTFQAAAGNNHGSFVVARQVDTAGGQQIWAMQCYNGSKGAVCFDSFPVEDFAFWDGKHPAVAVAGLNSDTFLIVYEETAPGDPSVHQRIFGRLFISRQWYYLPVTRH